MLAFLPKFDFFCVKILYTKILHGKSLKILSLKNESILVNKIKGFNKKGHWKIQFSFDSSKTPL